jgi:hypothetical protein
MTVSDLPDKHIIYSWLLHLLFFCRSALVRWSGPPAKLSTRLSPPLLLIFKMPASDAPAVGPAGPPVHQCNCGLPTMGHGSKADDQESRARERGRDQEVGDLGAGCPSPIMPGAD